jgi:hypothetical protein
LATNTQFPICPQIAHGSHPPVIKQAGLCAVDFLRRIFIGSTSVMDAKSRDRVGRHAFGGTSLFVGSAVGGLLKDGMPIERALSSTLTVAEFVTRGQAAQQAVGRHSQRRAVKAKGLNCRARARVVNFRRDTSKAKGGLPDFQAWAPV